MSSLGTPFWLGIVAVMLVITIVIFVVRGRKVFGKAGSSRFDTTEIPPDIEGAREFIVRDDTTGSLIQFAVLNHVARISSVEVRRKHEHTGVEVDLFQEAITQAGVALVHTPMTWVWPAVDDQVATDIRAFAATKPELEILDNLGGMYR